MIRLKSILAIGMFTTLTLNSHGQQTWIYNLNQFNPFDSFSAFAGSYDETSLTARHRQQWAGLEGAPQSSMLSAHGAISDLGWGVQLETETTGARSLNSGQLTGAYHLMTGANELSFALNASFMQWNLDPSKLSVREQGDVLVNQGDINASFLSLGFSTSYRTKSWLCAIQVNNLNEPSTPWFADGTGTFALQIDAMVAFDVKLSEAIKIRPMLAARNTANAAMSYDGYIFLNWNDVIWLGPGYRSDNIILGNIHWQISDRLRLAYAADMMTLNALSRPLSHEIFFGFNIGESKGHQSLRHFK